MLPVSAQEVNYKTSGLLNEYLTPNTAEVFWGSWEIRIENNDVSFRGRYLELNVEEEIPGTIDLFRLRLIDALVPVINDGVCMVEGNLVFRKIGWDNPLGPTLPGYKDLPGPLYRARFTIYVRITIDSYGILIEFDSPGIAGGIRGTTLSH